MSNPAEEDTPDAADSLKLASVSTEHATWQLQILHLPATIAIGVVRCYQALLSPLLGRTCRFHPSCSQYYIIAVRRYGLLSGSWRGIRRILRCHPWNPGGYDPP